MTSMMRMFSFSLILLIGVGLPVEHAEAKRFGGGMSFGKMFSSPKKATPAPKQAPAAAPAGANKTTTPASKPGMGGMVGGLLAGGLLGAMFFGGAFEGIQMMDILLIALVGFAIFAFLGRMRQPAQQVGGQGMGRQPEYAAPGSARYNEQQQDADFQADSHVFQSSTVLGSGLAEAELDLPTWFNKEAFLDGAKQHFETLQQAWSDNNLPLIETYCAPDFYMLLVSEREKLGSEQLHIDVSSVMAEILGFEEIDGEARISINFYGWMKESAGADTTEYNEIWHLTRDTLTAGSDWYLVGIEQP